jgi:hypothetical protein
MGSGLFDSEQVVGDVRPAEHFQPERIILAKGSDRSLQRVRLAEGICQAYPNAEVIEQLDVPHSQIDLRVGDPLARHNLGKRTLVLGEHNSAVRFSQEDANCCPNYWHFSPYGFCPYGCTYCYLAGTRGVWFSPTVKIYLNLEEMLDRIDAIANRAGQPTSFYLGKLQDGLALDPLTGYSRRIIPFFASHRWARLVVLTKSTQVENLLDLESCDRSVLSWSLNPRKVWQRYEPNTPAPENRLAAMGQCSQAGYRIRAVILPIIPVDCWQQMYDDLLAELLAIRRLERVTLGSLCSFPNAIRLTEAKIGPDDALSRGLTRGGKSPDGRWRFDPSQRLACYRHLTRAIKQRRPDVQVSLCLEQHFIFEDLGMTESIAQCNCVL